MEIMTSYGDKQILNEFLGQHFLAVSILLTFLAQSHFSLWKPIIATVSYAYN